VLLRSVVGEIESPGTSRVPPLLDGEVKFRWLGPPRGPVGEEEGGNGVAANLREMSLLLPPPPKVGETAIFACAGGDVSSVACCRTSGFRRGDADLPLLPPSASVSGCVGSVSMRMAIIVAKRSAFGFHYSEII